MGMLLDRSIPHRKEFGSIPIKELIKVRLFTLRGVTSEALKACEQAMMERRDEFTLDDFQYLVNQLLTYTNAKAGLLVDLYNYLLKRLVGIDHPYRHAFIVEPFLQYEENLIDEYKAWIIGNSKCCPNRINDPNWIKLIRSFPYETQLGVLDILIKRRSEFCMSFLQIIELPKDMADRVLCISFGSHVFAQLNSTKIYTVDRHILDMVRPGQIMTYLAHLMHAITVHRNKLGVRLRITRSDLNELLFKFVSSKIHDVEYIFTQYDTNPEYFR